MNKKEEKIKRVSISNLSRKILTSGITQKDPNKSRTENEAQLEQQTKQTRSRNLRRIGSKPTVKAFQVNLQQNYEHTSYKKSKENDAHFYQNQVVSKGPEKKLKRVGKRKIISAYNETIKDQNTQNQVSNKKYITLEGKQQSNTSSSNKKQKNEKTFQIQQNGQQDKNQCLDEKSKSQVELSPNHNFCIQINTVDEESSSQEKQEESTKKQVRKMVYHFENVQQNEKKKQNETQKQMVSNKQQGNQFYIKKSSASFHSKIRNEIQKNKLKEKDESQNVKENHGIYLSVPKNGNDKKVKKITLQRFCSLGKPVVSEKVQDTEQMDKDSSHPLSSMNSEGIAFSELSMQSKIIQTLKKKNNGNYEHSNTNSRTSQYDEGDNIVEDKSQNQSQYSGLNNSGIENQTLLKKTKKKSDRIKRKNSVLYDPHSKGSPQKRQKSQKLSNSLHLNSNQRKSSFELSQSQRRLIDSTLKRNQNSISVHSLNQGNVGVTLGKKNNQQMLIPRISKNEHAEKIPQKKIKKKSFEVNKLVAEARRFSKENQNR